MSFLLTCPINHGLTSLRNCVLPHLSYRFSSKVRNNYYQAWTTEKLGGKVHTVLQIKHSSSTSKRTIKFMLTMFCAYMYEVKKEKC